MGKRAWGRKKENKGRRKKEWKKKEQERWVGVSRGGGDLNKKPCGSTTMLNYKELCKYWLSKKLQNTIS